MKSNWAWKEKDCGKEEKKPKKRRGKSAKTKKKYKPDKTNHSKGFYNSWEWKKIRYEVLKTYGATCMLCNSTENIVVDHIKPISKFPHLRLTFSNLQVLCRDCNMGKSCDDLTDFRPDEEVPENKVAEELDRVHLLNVVSLYTH